jgi:hypothetical protein
LYIKDYLIGPWEIYPHKYLLSLLIGFYFDLNVESSEPA